MKTKPKNDQTRVTIGVDIADLAFLRQFAAHRLGCDITALSDAMLIGFAYNRGLTALRTDSTAVGKAAR